jgi:transposase InsO family protein
MGFIDTMRSKGHAVESTCRVLREQGCQVAARTYRAWKSRTVGPSARSVSDAHLLHTIRSVIYTPEGELTPEGLYGRRKLTAYLRRTTHPEVAFCTVDRCMRILGHHGVRRARKVRTTIPSADGKRAGDLLHRNFTAPAPNLVWVTDFTYVRTWAGFAYVAFVLDVFAHRIVGWHAATSKATDLVMVPLRIALWDRDRHGHPVGHRELIHHSDAGSQYTSIRFTEHLALEGILPSIGTVGDAYDNALMESTIGLYKTECIHTRVFHRGPYKTLADVEYGTAGWVDWYNNRRLHSSIGMIPPAEYEHAHYAALTREPQPT